MTARRAPRQGGRGSTVWITDSGWRLLLRAALDRLDRPGAVNVDRQAKTLLLDLLEEYLRRVKPLEPAARPCHIGTLLRYPGRQGTEKYYDAMRKEWREREVLLPGSRRLHLGVPPPTLQEATRSGLVLRHQWVATRPTGESVHPLDTDIDRASRSIADRARPLTDAVLTALVIEHGPLLDGPLTKIPEQITTQRTAQLLWDKAEQEAQSSSKSVSDVLMDTLPLLLKDSEARTAVETSLATWNGTLEELAASLRQRADRTPRGKRYVQETLV